MIKNFYSILLLLLLFSCKEKSKQSYSEKVTEAKEILEIKTNKTEILSYEQNTQHRLAL